MNCWIDSEIKRLKKVIIHPPGPEIEVMTPQSAAGLLYNDIIPLQVVAGEHSQLQQFLEEVCEVYQIKELLGDILQQPGPRREMEDLLVGQYGARHRRDDLSALSARELAEVCIGGLKKKSATLTDYLSPREFDILPLPNLFFTRDSAMAYRDGIIIAAMASTVRNMESVIISKVFQHHSLFQETKRIFQGEALHREECTLEGGDFLVIERNILCIGISERTSAEGVDRLIRQIGGSYPEDLTVFAVILPKERATIHLDMIFTRIDSDLALVHRPLISGRNKVRVVRIDVPAGGELKFVEEEGLLEGLAKAGVKLDTVSCGGEDALMQQREQWMSGANMFAFAPGKVIGYRSNTASLEALSGAGFDVKHADDFIGGGDSPDNYHRLAVTVEGIELSRGGGGIRCMTMPIHRG